MTVEEIVASRGILEVLHFTTQSGLTGILFERSLKCRNLLPETASLEFIRKYNTHKIFDPEWKGYVNLSLTRINRALFGYSQGWHPEDDWRILAFDPVVLTHEGVQFVTTNNAYGQHLFRGPGPESLERLFADTVAGIYGKPIPRTPNLPANWTTDRQAEVLYPRELSTKHLLKIYVRNQEDEDSVAGLLGSLGQTAIPLLVAPDLFE